MVGKSILGQTCLIAHLRGTEQAGCTITLELYQAKQMSQFQYMLRQLRLHKSDLIYTDRSLGTRLFHQLQTKNAPNELNANALLLYPIHPAIPCLLFLTIAVQYYYFPKKP
jgi:hypothetical protein